jgi:small conductance mechanosensitive channel
MEYITVTFDISSLTDLAVIYGIKLLSAILIFVIGKMVLGVLVDILKRLMTKSNVDATLVSFSTNILYWLGLTFIIIASLSKLGIETTSLAAAIAAAGLAIGLALQSSLANFASGVMLILFKPFKKGDYVEVAGTAGSVDNISIFTTTLKTPDNKVVIIPNGGITSGNIINYSAESKRRLDLVVGVGYEADLKQTKEVLNKVLSEESRILKDPEPTVAVSELGDSAVNLVVRPWVKTEDYWPVNFTLTENIKLALDEANISIPYPQRDIHIVSQPK